MAIALLGFWIVGPIVSVVVNILQGAVDFLVTARLLPLVSFFIEPGKILFMNNAIDHGILSPLGIQQVQETGKSILFLMETNPGPGLGILLAYWLFAKGNIKASAPGAVIIHFLGGIHEIYFPYILMRPVLILAAMAGGMSGVLTFMLTGAGEVAAPSPGSIFALIAVAPKGGLFPVLLGVVVATAVSFVVAMPFVKKFSDEGIDDEKLDEAKEAAKSLKLSGKIESIVFACDAGMGSSAMGANKLTKMLKAEGLGIKVAHFSVDAIPVDAQLVICHRDLMERVKISGTKAQCISVTNLLNAPEYKDVVELVRKSHR
jgi:PTS system mannitol-specific IIC component